MKQVKYDPSFKYITCYCNKKQIIRLGWGLNFYTSIFAVVFSVFLFIFVLVSIIDGSLSVFSSPLLLMAFLPVFLLLLRSSYYDCLKDMLKEGHTKECSRKVALKAAWRQSLYSTYKINVNPNEVDPQGHYATPVLGVWCISFMVNFAYFTLFSYEDPVSQSVIFPIVFTLSIVASTILLIRKNMKWYLFVMSLLTIISSAVLLTFYGLDIAVNFLN